MSATPKATRSVGFTYEDFDPVNDDEKCNYDVNLIEYEDGAVRCFLNCKPAKLSIEMLANWAYTLNNWRNRIERDIVKGQPSED